MIRKNLINNIDNFLGKLIFKSFNSFRYCIFDSIIYHKILKKNLRNNEVIMNFNNRGFCKIKSFNVAKVSGLFKFSKSMSTMFVPKSGIKGFSPGLVNNKFCKACKTAFSSLLRAISYPNVSVFPSPSVSDGASPILVKARSKSTNLFTFFTDCAKKDSFYSMYHWPGGRIGSGRSVSFKSVGTLSLRQVTCIK